MKFLITLSLLFFTFAASANGDNITNNDNKGITAEVAIGGDRGKKARHSKRINKKRKRKCAQFSRKGFAG